jgi:hypothetical protein
MYNYTGWIVGMSTSGTVQSLYTTMGGDAAQAEDGTWTGGGGGGGVWMGGSPIASDRGDRIFFNTGNGQNARVNGDLSATGRIHLDTLSESAVNIGIDPNTKRFSQQDYFEPGIYRSMDNADMDLGSGGIILPDSTVFSGTGVPRMAISCGKNSICHVLNRENLGGFKTGAGGTDAVIQDIALPGRPFRSVCTVIWLTICTRWLACF